MGGCESVGGIPEDTSLTFSVFGPNDTLRHKCHARIPRPESDRLLRRGHASCQAVRPEMLPPPLRGLSSQVPHLTSISLFSHDRCFD